MSCINLAMKSINVAAVLDRGCREVEIAPLKLRILLGGDTASASGSSGFRRLFRVGDCRLSAFWGKSVARMSLEFDRLVNRSHR